MKIKLNNIKNKLNKLKNWIVFNFEKIKLTLSGHRHIYYILCEMSKELGEYKDKMTKEKKVVNSILKLNATMIENINKKNLQSVKKLYQKYHKNFTIEFNEKIDKNEKILNEYSTRNEIFDRNVKLQEAIVKKHKSENKEMEEFILRSKEYLQSMKDEFERRYQNSMTTLFNEVYKFKENDQSIRRLTSLETRITNVEISLGKGNN